MQARPLSRRGILNPNAEGDGHLARISTPGHAMSMVAIKKYKLVNYAVCHCNQTTMHVTPGNFTLERCREVRIIRTQEKNYKDPDASETPTIQASNWLKTLEAIDLWVTKRRGIAKAPLGYVTRFDQVVQDLNTPRFGARDSPYHDHDAEMIARAPHFRNNITGLCMEAYA